jgi:hypothetical protein
MLLILIFLFANFKNSSGSRLISIRAIVDVIIPNLIIVTLSLIYLFQNEFWNDNLFENFDQKDLKYFNPTLNIFQILIGGGNWIDFEFFGPYPYCAWCPQLDGYLQSRISLTILVLMYSMLIIYYMIGHKILFILTITLTLFVYFSHFGKSSRIYLQILQEYEILQIFRSPWTKFSHFVPLTVILIVAIAFRFYMKSGRLLKQKNNLPFIYFSLVIFAFLLIIGVLQFNYLSIMLLLFFLLILMIRKIEPLTAILIYCTVLFIMGSTINMYNITNNKDQYRFIQNDFIDISKSYLFIESLNQFEFSATENLCFVVRTQSRASLFYYFALSNSSNNLNSENLEILIDNDQCLYQSDDFTYIALPLRAVSISSKYRFIFLKRHQLIFFDGNYAFYRLIS